MYRFMTVASFGIIALTALTGCGDIHRTSYPPVTMDPGYDDPRFGFVEGRIEEVKMVEASLMPTTIHGKYGASESARITPSKLLLKVSEVTNGKIYVLEVEEGTTHGPEALGMLLHPGSVIRFPTWKYLRGYNQFNEIFSVGGIGRMPTDRVSIVK